MPEHSYPKEGPIPEPGGRMPVAEKVRIVNHSNNQPVVERAVNMFDNNNPKNSMKVAGFFHSPRE